jgi:pyruvate/2-oxoglutarate dehydrogenase complex dihydrolipoamide acyltransferase (E2) component
MLLDFRVPPISPHLAEARVECVHAALGSALKPGDKLLDLSIDLSPTFEQDCPPISFFRIVVREPVVLREWKAEIGQTLKLGDVVALFSSASEESIAGPSQRSIRVAVAGIMQHSAMWTGSVRP